MADPPLKPPKGATTLPADPSGVIALLRCEALRAPLESSDFEIVSFDDVSALLASARRVQPRLCAVGPGLSAAALEDAVHNLRRELPFTDVVVWYPSAPPEAVRAALVHGARDVVLDPSPEAPAERIRRIVDKQTLLPLILEHEDRKDGAWRFEGLVSRNRRMWDVFETCIRTAATDASILILGETGTGKDLIARAVHRRSGRSGRFVALNCGAVPESLVDSQLFGHVEGAFTGAVDSKEGLFRHADGGTLLLDEIGNIPMSAQNRLLRTLQNETIRPVGGHEEIRVDVRTIAATSVPLERAIEEGTFREDLFYRLDVIRLIIPPLRERPEDIVFLFGHFVQRLADQYSLDRPRITGEFLDEVQTYDWPGNVRELENFVERLLLTHPGERLGRSHFRSLTRAYHGRESAGNDGAPEDGRPPRDRRPELRGAVVDIERPLGDVVEDAVEDIERAYLESLLADSRGRMGEAAAKADISRRTLLRKLKQYGIDRKSFRR
jgi:DNA-binding NtrC family response regulator